MPPMRSWMRVRIMRSVRERGPGAGRIHTEPLEYLVAAAAARFQPQLVQAQDVLVTVLIGALAHRVQGIDHGLKLLRQFGEHVAQHAVLTPAERSCERGVSTA